MPPRLIGFVFLSLAGLLHWGCEKAPSYRMLEVASQPLPESAPAEATIIVEWIETDTDRFTSWLAQNTLAPSDAVALRREVQSWLDRRRARLLEIAAVRTRSGHRSSTRSVHEVRFPAEYAYPVSRHQVKPENPDPAEEGKTIPVEKRLAGLAPAPARFETRDVGLTLEVECIVDRRAGLVDLTLSPEWNSRVDSIPWSATVEGDTETFETPVFDTNSFTSTIALQSGIYGFLGSARLDNGKVLLVFVRADTDLLPDKPTE